MALADTMAKLQMGEAFASLKLVDDFIEHGRLPKIHDMMGEAMKLVPPEERTGALDIGACHGLLSIRAAQLGWQKVVGVDIDQRSVDVFKDHLQSYAPNVEMEQATIHVLSPSFERWLNGMAARGLDTILARRIFPELFVTTYKARKKPEIWTAAGRRFGHVARDAGFKRIILEGRIWKNYWNKNRGNPLYRTEREMVALGPLWKCEARYDECAIMIPS